MSTRHSASSSRAASASVLHVVVPDRHLMTLEFLEAGQRAHRVEIVVENRNLHALRPANRRARSGAKLGARPNAFPFTTRARDRWNGAKSFLFNCVPRRILTVRTRRRSVERQQRAGSWPSRNLNARSRIATWGRSDTSTTARRR